MDDGTDQTDSSFDLVSSTGANDQNSVWWSGLLQTALPTLTSAGASAADRAITNALGLQTSVQPAAAAPSVGRVTLGNQSQSPARSNTLLYVLAGAAVLVLGWLLMRGR